MCVLCLFFFSARKKGETGLWWHTGLARVVAAIFLVGACGLEARDPVYCWSTLAGSANRTRPPPPPGRPMKKIDSVSPSTKKRTKKKGKPAGRPARWCKKAPPARILFFFHFSFSTFVSPSEGHCARVRAGSPRPPPLLFFSFFFLGAAACLVAGPADKSAPRAGQKSARCRRASAPSGPSCRLFFGPTVCRVGVVRDCAGPPLLCSCPYILSARHVISSGGWHCLSFFPHFSFFLCRSLLARARAFLVPPPCLSLFCRWRRWRRRRTRAVDHTHTRAHVHPHLFSCYGRTATPSSVCICEAARTAVIAAAAKCAREPKNLRASPITEHSRRCRPPSAHAVPPPPPTPLLCVCTRGRL